MGESGFDFLEILDSPYNAPAVSNARGSPNVEIGRIHLPTALSLPLFSANCSERKKNSRRERERESQNAYKIPTDKSGAVDSRGIQPRLRRNLNFHLYPFGRRRREEDSRHCGSARIDTRVTGSLSSRDINVNDKEKRHGNARTVGGNMRFARGFSTLDEEASGNGTKWVKADKEAVGWRWQQREETRYPVPLPLLFPLIKISNMITADLATIIKRLAEFVPESSRSP